jgi:hypothetical protein
VNSLWTFELYSTGWGYKSMAENSLKNSFKNSLKNNLKNSLKIV